MGFRYRKLSKSLAIGEYAQRDDPTNLRIFTASLDVLVQIRLIK